MPRPLRVTVWNEFRHEKQHEECRRIYPDGIHAHIARFLARRPDTSVRTAVLDEPRNGLADDVLAGTDVLLWWGHAAHHEVSDEVVDAAHRRILDGMGFIALHSALGSKIFRQLMGTSCRQIWREAGEKERLWVVAPAHPIAEGLPRCFELARTEMYGEPWDIPSPDDLVLVSWFAGGEVFRSGCCWYRGCGRVFYFRPGHETYPAYHDEQVLRVIANAVAWAAPRAVTPPTYGNRPALETLE